MSPSKINISGLYNSSLAAVGSTTLQLYSRLSITSRLVVDALVVPQITSEVPSSMLDSSIVSSVSRHGDAYLADPTWWTPGPIDVLIGSDVLANLFDVTSSKISIGFPSRMHTIFGDVLFGTLPGCVSPVSEESLPVSLHVQINSSPSTLETLDEILQAFWELEELPSRTFPAPQDDLAERMFRDTTTRCPTSGRYCVALPFAPDAPPIDSNRTKAYRFYLAQEARLRNNEIVRKKYHDFLQECLDLGHMEEAPDQSSYVIPHHAVFRQHDPHGKVRVVFNASCPDVSGFSLNHRLLPGPKLQADVRHVLHSFRRSVYAISADCQMMFRMVSMRTDHQQFQHIFWRPDPLGPVKEYRLTTVVYGLASSPFQAQRVLHQLVEDEGHRFPLAAKAIMNNRYVDDIISCADDLPTAAKLISELTDLLAAAGFSLRKWISNCPSLLAHLPQDHLVKTECFLDDTPQTPKILGVRYSPSDDTFFYTVTSFEGIITKRTALSYVARTYDPLGWLSPVILRMKLFLQTLWTLNINWDTPLDNELAQTWLSLVSSLPEIESLHIPRLIGPPDSPRRLIGFCDASSEAYGAVLYLHSDNADGLTATVRLIAGKTKVAPVKTPQTIPRLELCGALLLARLLDTMRPCLSDVNLTETFLFCDAKVVLDWMHTPLHKLKQFVANRIARILELTSLERWTHVSSENNIADLASRGCTVANLLTHTTWWDGPLFIRQHYSLLPPAGYVSSASKVPESKPSQPIVLVIDTPPENELFSHFNRFSSFRTMIRVAAYCLRFIKHCYKRPASNPLLRALQSSPVLSSLSLEVEEMDRSTRLCVQLTQQHFYPSEIKDLRRDRPVKNWLPLTPFLDAENLIRVGGRLVNSSLSDTAKHPLILPKSAPLSSAIIDHYHKIVGLHCGPRTCQSLISQRFWILSARSVVRQRIRNCMTCIRFRPPIVQPLMGNLPTDRVTPQRPFLACGLDYAGPFPVRSSTFRSAKIFKGYLLIIVCMASKAIHLEFVSDLTTAVFLAAFDRFISRRGLPHDVYSDNGKTFRGAARHLQELFDFLTNSTDIVDQLAAKQIRWHFQPPYTPFFGGLMEAGVKSAKNLFKRLIGDRPLLFEEYATLFARIEAVLNSRPLCDFHEDPSEEMVSLTPGHFLIGTPLLAVPERPVDVRLTPHLRWKRLQALVQQFWNQWSKEYLQALITRRRWNKTARNIQLGEIVIIKQLNTSPLCWPLAKVTAVHPGADGVVRVVTLSMAGKSFRRAVSRVHPLGFAASQ